MQRLEVGGAVRPLYGSLGFKGLKTRWTRVAQSVIAPDYGLDGPVIESRWGRDFPRAQTGPGAHSASCTMGTGSFPGGKVRPGRAADHSPRSSAAVMEE